MKRREFISLLGGAMAASPFAARAQQPMPVIGFLDFGSAAERTQQIAAFRKGLAEGGYQEGQNVALEFGWAEGQYARFAELAADFVHRGVRVIAVPGSGTGALAAKAAIQSDRCGELSIDTARSRGGHWRAAGNRSRRRNRPGNRRGVWEYRA
jgi:putative tryptophan/tyrosine transport system substrate-binding protein